MDQPNAIHQFIRRQDSATTWSRSSGDLNELRLISQSWQGQDWRHRLLLIRPAELIHSDTCLLEITGDDAGAPDLELGRALAESSGMLVAILFDVPNQPIEGRIEDDLIAHTFEQFLASGDPEDILLFPMTKSVFAALDAIQASECQIRNFVLTGASKRGWTTWLAGLAGDPRIIGIAPRVFDNLSFAAQLEKQVRDWGGYSPEIVDYTGRGLQDFVQVNGGEALISLVDPFARIAELRVPVLIVSGSNDAYWTVDAINVFWDDIPTAKSLLIVPNVGHHLGDHTKWVPTIGAFARAVSAGESLPELGVAASASRRVTRQYWSAWSADLNFSFARFEPDRAGDPDGGYHATFTEALIEDKFGTYRVTSLVTVEPQSSSS